MADSKLVLNPENWRDFTPDAREPGDPEAVRWANREVMHAPDWSKWHATDGRAFKTACGQLIVPFAVDGSPEFRDIESVNCRRCRAAIDKGKAQADKHAPGSLWRRDTYKSAQ